MSGNGDMPGWLSAEHVGPKDLRVRSIPLNALVNNTSINAHNMYVRSERRRLNRVGIKSWRRELQTVNTESVRDGSRRKRELYLL